MCYRSGDLTGAVPIGTVPILAAEGISRTMTWAENGLMEALVPLSPASVLRLLADVATTAAGELPAVSVHLAGGQALDGALVGLGTDRGSEVAVLADPQRGRLSYALVASVVAVELCNPALFQDVITGGQLPLAGVGQPPTPLALRREFAPTDEFPLHADWAALTESGLPLGNVAALLRGLRDAVVQVRTDEIGQRAWHDVRVLRVEHLAGSDVSVTRIPDGLSVGADMSRALPRALASELCRKVSALL
jgi:hypothetical protein